MASETPFSLSSLPASPTYCVTICLLRRMTGHSCFICASNEGVFLNASNNKQICQWIERCLHVKISAKEQSSIKICHKCTFELGQCNSFLKKYEEYKRSGLNTKKSCIVCRQAGKTRSIFDLSNDSNFQQKSFHKLQKIFNDEFKKPLEDFKFMCLSCLYTVDVLLDLRNICNRTSTYLKDITNKEIDYLTFPKIETVVANRKTTNTEPFKVTLQDLEDNMTRTRAQNNKLNNEETQQKPTERCDVCHGFIDLLDKRGKLVVGEVSGICATCQNKIKKSEKVTKSPEKRNLSGTKDCTVYLKDVLKERDEMKEQQVYKVDEDLEGSKTFVVKEKDSKTEKKFEKREKRSKKRSVQTENEEASEVDVPKRKKSKPIEDSDTDSGSVALRTRQLRRRNIERVSKPAGDKRLTRRQRATSAPLSDTDADKKGGRMKTKRNLRSIDENDKSSSNNSSQLTRKRRRIASTSTWSDPTDQIENARSSEECDNREDIFKSETHVCDECGASFENKLISLTHKLLHYKQPKLRLQKINPKGLMKEVSRKADDQNEEPSENITIVVDDDEDEVVADESKSMDNDSSVKDGTKDVSQRETVEDDNVDMTLVMKDSDEEQNLRPDDAETQRDTSFVEDIEINTDSSLTKDKNEKAEDKRQSNVSNENNNDKAHKSIEEAEDVNKNSEEEQAITNGDIEDVQERSKDDVERDGDIENKNADKGEGDKSIAEDKNENESIEKKENNEDVGHEKEEKSVKENNEKDSEIEVAQKVQEIENEQAEKDKDAVEAIENDENREDKTDEKQQNLDKSSKSIDDSIVVEDDSPKESNEDDCKIQEMKNGAVVQSDLMDTSKEMSLEPEKEKSAKANVVEICDSDSPDSVVLRTDELNNTEDENTVIDLEDEKEKQKNSTSDSANAAAEVLQEVLDLASAEFQKRLENMNMKNESDTVEAETLENISREVNNGVDTLASEGTKSRSPSLVE